MITVLLPAAWQAAADADALSTRRVKASILNCDIQQGPCALRLNDLKVTLEIEPRPVKAMADLTFTIRIDPAPLRPRPPRIRLNMPAMDMGINEVPLKAVAPGVYRGRGVVVRCRSGLRTWMAEVVLPDAGRLEFIFDVIY